MTDRVELARLLAAEVAATPSAGLPALIGMLAQTQAEAQALMVSAAVAIDRPASGFRALSPETVASRLEIPVSQVYSLMREGKLPSVKLGKYVRVPEEALEEWLQSQLDNRYTRRILPSNERLRVKSGAAEARVDSGPTRGAARSDPKHRRPLGAGRTNHSGSDLATHHLCRKGGGAPEVDPARQTLNG